MANEVVKQQQTLQQLMNSGAVVKKMNDVLGSEKKASSFISSVISVSQNNKLLRNAEPMSILSCLWSFYISLSVVLQHVVSLLQSLA